LLKIVLIGSQKYLLIFNPYLASSFAFSYQNIYYNKKELMEKFYLPLLGGAMIGLGAVILMAGLRRIAGFSGILGQILGGNDKREAWRFVFIAGVLAGPFALCFMGNRSMNLAVPSVDLSWLIGAGLLVGVGTTLANGCTSGHGICGLSRLSPRSLVATLTFMVVAIITVYVMKGLK
jgi:uncharacterized protein